VKTGEAKVPIRAWEVKGKLAHSGRKNKIAPRRSAPARGGYYCLEHHDTLTVGRRQAAGEQLSV